MSALISLHSMSALLLSHHCQEITINDMAGPAHCAHQTHFQCLKLDRWFRLGIPILMRFPCQVDHHNDKVSMPVLVSSHLSRSIPGDIILVVPVGVLGALTSYADDWILQTLVKG